MSEGVKLMTPLFIGMNFNKEGKRIRARYIKTLIFDGIEYPLWISVGKNENDFPQADNDTHYLMIEANDYLIPCGLTEYNLELHSGYAYLVSKWYGSDKARDEFYRRIMDGKGCEESNLEIKRQIAKENKVIIVFGKDEGIQAEYIKNTFIDSAISKYIDARDNGGNFASFQGAAFLGEVERCYEINKVFKAERKKAEAIKRAEQVEKEKKEAEALVTAELAKIKEAEKAFVNGGTITDSKLIVKIADKYEVNIPIRTRGWMLNRLTECTISDNGGMCYRYWKSKTGKGSQKVYDVLFGIRISLLRLKQINT